MSQLHEPAFLLRHGEWKAMTHWPPGYSAALVPGHWLGIGPRVWACVLQAIATGLTAALAAIFIRRAGGHAALALLCGLSIGAAPDVLQAASMIWSESLFTPLTVFTLLACLRYLEPHAADSPVLADVSEPMDAVAANGSGIAFSHVVPPHVRWLMLAIVAAGAATMLRYAGLAVVGLVIFTTLIARAKAWPQRIGRTMLAALAAMLPLVLWLLRNRLVHGDATNRALAYHPPDLTDWQRARDAVGWWFLPRVNAEGWWELIDLQHSWIIPMPDPQRLIHGAWIALWAGIGVMLLAALAMIRPRTRPAAALSAVFAAGYFVLILATMTWYDDATPLDERILAPAHIALLLLGGVGLAALLPRTGRSRLTHTLVLLTTLIASAAAVGTVGRAAVWAWTAPTRSLVYNSPRWRESELVQLLRDRPGTDFYTNAEVPAYFGVGRWPGTVPRYRERNAKTPREKYPTEIARMREDLGTAGLVAYFTGVPYRDIPPLEVLMKDADLEVVAETDDGVLLRLK